MTEPSHVYFLLDETLFVGGGHLDLFLPVAITDIFLYFLVLLDVFLSGLVQ